MSSASGRQGRAEGGANALNNASLKSVSNLVKLPKTSKKAKAQSAIPSKYIMYPLEYKGKLFEIHITPSRFGTLQFVVKKPGNYTNCITFTYTPNDKSVYLNTLLYGVDAHDECRHDGTNGPFYLSLIFNILKGCFKPFKIRKFTLTDAASIPTASGIDNPSLSTIKLLTDSRTFYEGYGFLPVFATDTAKVGSKAYLDLLRAYLIDRHEILTAPIAQIIPKITAMKYFEKFTDLNDQISTQQADIIYALNSILQISRDLGRIPNLAVPADMVLSLSNLFRVLPEVDISSLSGANLRAFNRQITILRRTIYYIVNTYMNNFGTNYSSYIYYCGERDSDFYNPIQEMYESINGNRREVYARYLNRPFRIKKEDAAAAANTSNDVNIELLPETIKNFEAIPGTEMPTDAELTMDKLLGQAEPTANVSGASASASASASAARPNNRRSRKVNSRLSQQQPLRLSNLQSGMERLSMASSPTLNGASRPRPVPAPRRLPGKQPAEMANNNRAAAIAALASLQRPRPQPPARY